MKEMGKGQAWRVVKFGWQGMTNFSHGPITDIKQVAFQSPQEPSFFPVFLYLFVCWCPSLPCKRKKYTFLDTKRGVDRINRYLLFSRHADNQRPPGAMACSDGKTPISPSL